MALLQRSSFTLPNRLSGVGRSDRSGRNGAIILQLRHRRRGHTRHFAGERDRHDARRLVGEKLPYPGGFRPPCMIDWPESD
ncbi:MAG: hypothetical protein CR217_07855 [Beijerinckiaceae bacterium]|nr:MAG: hypothetical protein CR217_07855 [Beijerinckiaceae bacterium]